MRKNIPIVIAPKPAISCRGIISISGNFLTINIKTAKDIGIKKAAKLPIICPAVNDPPSINVIPLTARIIEVMLIWRFFPLRKYIQTKLEILFEFE